MTATTHQPPPSDLRIVRASRGDRAALAELAREWAPQIRRWALFELGDPVLADDAAQEALVRLCRSVGRLDPQQSFSGWLRTITRNAARDVARQRGRLAARAAGIEDEPAAEPDPDRGLDLRRGADHALDATATLTIRQREVLVRCDVMGATPSEVAVELDIAAGTARALLHQARRALRAEILRHHPELQELVR